MKTWLKNLVFSGLLVSLFGVGFVFSGCGGSNGLSNVDQDEICAVSNDEDLKYCKKGKLAAFLPNSWGSERYPIRIIARFCDTNHQIFFNNSGVVCVFNTDGRKKILNSSEN